MKETECPICWSKDVKIVDAVYLGNQNVLKPLMFCDLCEKYYWGDTNEIVANLSIFCRTYDQGSKLCYLREENPGLSKNTNCTPCKLLEFNLLCGYCPHRRLRLNP